MSHELLLEKAHALVDTLNDEQLEYYVGIIERGKARNISQKKCHTTEELNAILERAGQESFSDNAYVESMWEAIKNDVW